MKIRGLHVIDIFRSPVATECLNVPSKVKYKLLHLISLPTKNETVLAMPRLILKAKHSTPRNTAPAHALGGTEDINSEWHLQEVQTSVYIHPPREPNDLMDP